VKKTRINERKKYLIKLDKWQGRRRRRAVWFVILMNGIRNAIEAGQRNKKKNYIYYLFINEKKKKEFLLFFVV
jgi:hypothetical protein